MSCPTLFFTGSESGLEGLDKIVDRWTRQQASGIIATLITAILQAEQHGYQLSPQWQKLIEKSYDKNELVHLFVLWDKTFKQQLSVDEAKEELAWIDEVFDHQSDYIYDNSNFADILIVKAHLLLFYPELSDAKVSDMYEELLLEALDYEFKFSAYKFLGDYYRSEGRHADAIALLESKFDDISTATVDFRGFHSLLTREVQAGKLLKPVLEFPPVGQS